MSRKFYNIQTTNARNVFNGNGVTTVFTTDFAFIAAASLKVTLVSAAGVETPQVLNTNYTVSGGLNNQGNPDVGSVTMLVAPPIGSRLVVERVESYVQPSTFQRFGGIPIKVVELCLDRLTLLAQQLLELSGRALHYPASESLITSGVLPDNANRAGKYLFFNASTGAPEAAAGTADATPHNALMVALHIAADAAAARATLGAGDVQSTRTITAGAGLTGGGDLTADRTIAADFANQTEAEAGASTTKIMSPARVANAIAQKPFTASYDSGEQTITGGALLTLSHGLGAKPKIMAAWLRCKTAELGYLVDEEVYIGGMQTDIDQAAASRGFSLYLPNATDIKVRYGSSGVLVPSGGTGAMSSITVGNWRLIVRAYK